MNITGMRDGDIAEIDHLGRRFYGMVTDVEDRKVHFRPLDRRITWRSCTSNEVIGHWRPSKATRARVASAFNGGNA